MVADISHVVRDFAASELVKIGVLDPVQHVLHAIQQRRERFFLRVSNQPTKKSYILRNALKNVRMRGDPIRADVFFAFIQRCRIIQDHSVLDIVQISHGSHHNTHNSIHLLVIAFLISWLRADRTDTTARPRSSGTARGIAETSTALRTCPEASARPLRSLRSARVDFPSLSM